MKIHLTMNGATDTHLDHIREAVAPAGNYHDDYHLVVQTESATTVSGGTVQADINDLTDENHRLTAQNESLADALATTEAALAASQTTISNHRNSLEDARTKIQNQRDSLAQLHEQTRNQATQLTHNDGYIRGLEDQLAAHGATNPVVPIGRIVKELTPNLITALPIGARFASQESGVLVKNDDHGMAWEHSNLGTTRLSAVGHVFGPFARLENQDTK